MPMVARPPYDRWIAKVDKNGPIPEYAPHLGPCWLWTAAISSGGYGNFMRRKGVFAPAHRWSYEHHVGQIADGLDLDHLCRVRRCVNPVHLEPVTRRENLLRGVTVVAVNASRTHCPQGHPYDEKNTGRNGSLYGRPTRSCKTCKRDRARARRASRLNR